MFKYKIPRPFIIILTETRKNVGPSIRSSFNPRVFIILPNFELQLVITLENTFGKLNFVSFNPDFYGLKAKFLTSLYNFFGRRGDKKFLGKRELIAIPTTAVLPINKKNLKCVYAFQ